jgi:hypothetical protein
VNANGVYRHEVGFMTPDGITHELTSTPDVHEGGPRLSPDGTKVVFASRTWALPDWTVEVMNADGSERRTLATVPSVTWPVWSPDGTKILYVDGYIPKVLTIASGAAAYLAPEIYDAHESLDWAALPGTVAPPAVSAVANGSRTVAQASGIAATLADGGIRALALPDPSTVASSSLSASSIWPYRDGYRDTLKVSLRMREPARSRVDIYNSAGTRVKAVSFGWRTGPFSWRWTGRNAAGSILASGRYRVVTTATDLAGNVLRKTFYVSLYRGRP